MKLRNKKTGEIKAFDEVMREAYKWNNYNSLAELDKEWEDYEEPKEYWYIDADGEVICEPSDNKCKFDNNCREIGNYFETKEEAEKAVEKLKAWKRLKEARFAFGLPEYRLNEDSSIIGATGSIGFSCLCYEDFDKDLDLLFGGEE